MCIFCSIINGELPSNIVYQDDKVIAILDLAQVTKGHTLVMPKKHYDNIFDVDEETLKQMIVVCKKLSKQLVDNLHADGLNIVNNNGQQAGQAIEHIHFHLIPRYKDDDYLIKGQEHKYDLKEVSQIVKG